jgi:Flp pilus assembly protein TadG
VSNAGTPIAGITVDFDGDARNASTPDIGADEIGATTTTLGVALANGWNLVSLPVTNPLPGDSVRQIFPTSLNPYAFEFAGGYTQRYRLANGKGYWAKFPAAATQNVTGTPRYIDSMSVNAGWNIVGSISNPVDTNTIISVPAGIRASNWFGYAGGYTPVTQIIPGKGYWVKASAAGRFVMANPLAAAKTQTSVNPLESMNSVTITDSRGGSQTLYFGTGKDLPVSMYAMPPAPPAGAFDARIESADGGSLVAVHPAEAGSFTVAVQSDAYPLTISWTIGSGTYALAATNIATPMTGEGSVRVTNSGVSKFGIALTGASTLPKEFALQQNYPNPFNPSTTIRYALPVQSVVTLEVFNVLGQRVRTLVSDIQAAGYRTMEWDGRSNSGQQLASGVYFLQIAARGENGVSFTNVRKLMMMK